MIVVVFHIQRSETNSRELLYRVANPTRGLLNREKITKRKPGSSPPPTHTQTYTVRTEGAYNEENGQKEHHMLHLRVCPGATQISVRFASVQDPSNCELGELVSLRKFYASVYEPIFPVPLPLCSLGEV